jgi:ADP-ribose pyrophosphatase
MSFSASDCKIIEKETCYRGFFRMMRLHFTHKLFKGGWSSVVTREVFVRPDASCVLLFDPRLKRVVLVEQIRVGALLEGRSPWMLELVAGLQEEGETPEAVARREALEEAGARVNAMKEISVYYPSPGGCNEKIHLFCGQVDATELGGIHGLEAEGEDILVRNIKLQDAYGLLDEGALDNSPVIMALMWLRQHQAQLEEEWGGAISEGSQ